MATIQDKIDGLEKFNLNKVLLKIFRTKKIEGLVFDLIRGEQLFKRGVDQFGRVIGKYSATTEAITAGETFRYRSEVTGKVASARQKLEGTPIFLLDTGDFYASFQLKPASDGVIVDAITLKDDGTDLIDEYGEILGLTDESRQILIKAITPMVQKALRKALG